MNLNLISLKKSIKGIINNPTNQELEEFKETLKRFKDKIDNNEGQTEDNIRDFLKDTFYKEVKYDIKTQDDKRDLSIYESKYQDLKLFLELKLSSEQKDFITQKDINRKSFFQSVFYYLREKINGTNTIDNIIISNAKEFFIFDSTDFNRLFNKGKYKKIVENFNDKKGDNKTREDVYKSLKNELENDNSEISATYFDISSIDLEKQDNVKELYKVLSPQFLLKEKPINDNNILNIKFYKELLYIMGLEEVKEDNKLKIKRVNEKDRRDYSLLENTIFKIKENTEIEEEEKLFELSLSLVLTWVNRILFLKLLEGQIVRFNDDKKLKFLNIDTIDDFDELNTLFFSVLAIKENERDKRVSDKYKNIPYLNSSLFEISENEKNYLKILGLKNSKIEIYNSTILNETEDRDILKYLFDFLDAYNFGHSEGETNDEKLISASVLGLIFEKINGYKDGSVYTPSFITMYMCRESISKAVVQKFNEIKGWECNFLIELKNNIDDKKEANEIFNSIKICDPSVGSGHFLVSALNELIRIKKELNILISENGETFKDYDINIINDELIIVDENGKNYNYKKNNTESQRVQKTLFNEKKTLIENCLFGVDINSNSVNICRLRLWIELLKNTYYNENNTLETLPNIDINIKAGNSLVSKINISEGMTKYMNKKNDTLKYEGYLKEYRQLVFEYKNATNRKKQIRERIGELKTYMKLLIPDNSKTYKDLQKINSTVADIQMKYERTKNFNDIEGAKDYKEKLDKALSKQLNIKKKYDDEQKIYDNSLEWRLEFPEVLDDKGDFIGFDCVIGNPPYISIRELDKKVVKYYFNNYNTTVNRINLYSTFVERGRNLLKKGGNFSFIIPNSILMNSSYKLIRDLIKNEINEIIKLPDNIFSSAIVETIILSFQKEISIKKINVIRYNNNQVIKYIDYSLKTIIDKNIWDNFNDLKFNIYLSYPVTNILNKCYSSNYRLKDYAKFSLGITPYDKYKGHSSDLIKNKGYHSPNKKNKSYKPLISGKNITPYMVDDSVKEYINYGNWLGAPREEYFFTKPRVIVRQIISGTPPKIYAGYTEKELYFTQIGFGVIAEKNLKPKFLTALLNSNLINFIHKYMYLDLEKKLFQKVLIENCKSLPIMLPKNQKPFVDLVDKILKLKEQNKDTTKEEKQIDQMVYSLYGLTDDEVKVIESK